jgi:tRNA (mo5U34)-methyltransferase
MNNARFMIPAPTTVEGLAVDAAKLSPWFHNLHLPDGSETAPSHPLGDFPSNKWEQIGPMIPEDLVGWSALDVGCNSGFYSFELARRGACVTAVEPDLHFLNQAQWAARQYHLEGRIEFVNAGIYDLAGCKKEYDLVLFMGVFYHLRYPLLGLDILASMTRRMMVFQTLTMPGEAVEETPLDQDFDDRNAMAAAGWPKMAFIEHSLAGDPTNWWAPNHAGVEALLRSAGLRVCSRPGHEIYVCEPSPELPGDAMFRTKAELAAATGRAL